MTFDWNIILFCPCKLFSFYISIKLNVKVISYLMFIRYCASATDSAFPVIVMVRSIFVLFPLTFGSRSSQFDMRIIAPLSCLQVQNSINGMHRTINSTSKLQFFRNLCQSNAVKSFYKLKKLPYFSNFWSAFADDASNELIGYCHFMRLLCCLWPTLLMVTS